MGRLMAVASMNMARTKRLLPATALALQVKLDQAIQIRVKRRTNSPNPSRVGMVHQVEDQPGEGEDEAQVEEQFSGVRREVLLAARNRDIFHGV